MASSTTNTRRSALRSLAALLAVAIACMALIAGLSRWGDPKGEWTPRLGLDLEGGTEMVLAPVLDSGATASSEQINQAVEIIRQRIDANGVSESEISTLGGQNIVVAIPGSPTPEQLEAIRKPSQLRFRAVFVAQPQAPAVTPEPTVTGTAPAPGATGTATAPGATGTAPVPAPTPTGAATTAGGIVPPAFAPATGETVSPQTPVSTDTPAATAPVPTAPGDTTAPVATDPAATAEPTVSDAQIKEYVAGETTSSLVALGWAQDKAAASAAKVADEFMALDCSAEGALENVTDVVGEPMATCGTATNPYKYVLGPVELDGSQIADATSGYQAGPNGQPTAVVEVALTFQGEGVQKFRDITKRLLALKGQEPKDQFAVVLDRTVITAPSSNAEIPDGRASITGSFTLDSAKQLAEQLKFGALPMSFALQTQNDITPQLGQDQLRIGLIAGAVGLLLVVVYSLFQYRALGLVTVASLVVAMALTYLALTILGTTHGFRLTMAGVTGVIVAIGVTADSFIVYFERIRDEVREGRPLVAAVETGWKRARRTILAADAVNFLAAIVLYLLASSNVRGFAFTLGLTTVIDLLVVVLFTHPMVQLLARTRFFGNGHRWSGLDPERLGAKVSPRYRGRGQYLRPGPATASSTNRIADGGTRA